MIGESNFVLVLLRSLCCIAALASCTCAGAFAPQRVVRSGGQQVVTVDDETGVTLTGLVVDARGEPVPAAEVEAWIDGSEESTRVRAWADGEGLFRLARVPDPGPWRLRATAAGMSFGRGWTSHAEWPARIELLPAIRMHGVLRDKDGTPAVGVAVRGIAFLAGAATEEFTVTDADGAFVLQKLHRGAISVVAAVPGEGLYQQDLRATGDCELTLTARTPRTGELRVEVTGLEPAEALATRIELRPNDGFPGLPPPWCDAHLEADGTCVLREIPIVPYKLRLLGPHACQPELHSVPIRYEPQTLRFAAAPPTAIRVRIFDAYDVPCAGLPVGVYARSARREERANSVTNGEGLATFVLRSIVPSTFQVRSLDAELEISMVRQGVTVPSPTLQVMSEVQVLLASRGVPVTGRVVDATGAPAAGAWCVITSSGGRGSVPFVMTTCTDREGRFRMHTPYLPDPVSVSVAGEHGFGRCDALAMHAEEGLEFPELQLAAPASIDGIVRDARGLPAPGVLVWLSRLDHDVGWPTGADQTMTDGDGHFRFVGARPGAVRLQVTPGGRRPDPENDPGQQLDLTSGQSAWTELTVTLPD